MSIFDKMFGSTPTPAPASAAANPTLPGNNAGITPESNPSAAAIPKAPEGDQSSLANFATLWEAKPAGDTPTFIPNFSFDPAKVGEAAAKIDFTKVIDPAMAQKALSGDMASFMQVLNKVSQAGFAQAVTASGLMAQESAKRTGTSVQAALPEFLRQQQAGNLAAESPFFMDPATKPLIEAIQQQVAIAYPNASAADLGKYTKNYFAAMAKEYVASEGNVISPAPKALAGETDWSNFG